MYIKTKGSGSVGYLLAALQNGRWRIYLFELTETAKNLIDLGSIYAGPMTRSKAKKMRNLKYLKDNFINLSKFYL